MSIHSFVQAQVRSFARSSEHCIYDLNPNSNVIAILDAGNPEARAEGVSFKTEVSHEVYISDDEDPLNQYDYEPLASSEHDATRGTLGTSSTNANWPRDDSSTVRLERELFPPLPESSPVVSPNVDCRGQPTLFEDDTILPHTTDELASITGLDGDGTETDGPRGIEVPSRTNRRVPFTFPHLVEDDNDANSSPVPPLILRSSLRQTVAQRKESTVKQRPVDRKRKSSGSPPNGDQVKRKRGRPRKYPLVNVINDSTVQQNKSPRRPGRSKKRMRRAGTLLSN
jgi:hypothetical protein